MPDTLTCFNCDREIRIDQPFEQVPGVTVPDGTAIQHTVCPPGTCASCGTEMPYDDLVRIELADGEIDEDPDLLACANVFHCQVRTGERDPDDIPQDAR